MNNDDALFEYLNGIYKLEQAKLTYEKAYKELRSYKQAVTQKRNITKPGNKTYADSDQASETILGKGAFACGIAIIIIATIIACVTSGGRGGFWGFVDAILTGLITLVITTACVWGALKIFYIIYGKILSKREHSERLSEYREAVAQEEKRYNDALMMSESMQNQIDDVWNRLNKVKSTLNKMYALDIVHVKYRNIVPIAMFCEYLSTGRCYRLTGHEGAYNLYENELRQNLIISKLDDIYYKLNSIQESQYMVYNAICESQRTADKILQNSYTTAKNSALAAYNSQIVAENTYVMKNLMIWDTYIKAF